jgi:hypothetical protein
VLASRLPEIEKIVKGYGIGMFIENHEPKHIAQMLQNLLESPEYPVLKANTAPAAAENSWEQEQQKLVALLPR